MDYKNIEGSDLEICSTDPMTGYNNDGKCSPDRNDFGKHLVCAELNKKFLDFTNKRGNNLHSLKDGDRWCLCQKRYLEAFREGKAPKVIKEATYSGVNPHVKRAIMRGGSKKILKLPKLRKINKTNKKYLYHLNDKQSKRILAINEDLNKIKNKTKKRDAASKKKKRFNIIRLYRKNKDKKGCKKLTKDMKYLDKKYRLGKTKNIC
jgi:uncharacterized protein